MSLNARPPDTATGRGSHGIDRVACRHRVLPSATPSWPPSLLPQQKAVLPASARVVSGTALTAVNPPWTGSSSVGTPTRGTYGSEHAIASATTQPERETAPTLRVIAPTSRCYPCGSP